MIRPGLTFDDVLLEPRRTAVNRRDASVETRLTKQARLAIPLLSAASDTVSDARFAIALGKLGGMAVLHRNCSFEQQVAMVKEVKAAGLAQIGVAVGPKDIERAAALAVAGATHIFTDCAHAHAPGIIAAMKEMKRRFKSLASLPALREQAGQTRHSLLQRENKSLPPLPPPRLEDSAPLLGQEGWASAPFNKGRIRPQLIAGNIATKEAAKDFAFADALKVGIGPGSICVTRIVSGVGVPQLTAVMDVVSVAKKYKIPVIADGGIRTTGDMVKAFAAGADAVMMGGMFAGADEAPGEVITENGVKYKTYRGMGSPEALEKRHAVDRYGMEKKHHVAEGVAGKVLYKGTAADIVEEMIGGIKAGMGYVGAATIADIAKQARFIQITNAGLSESHPHSLS